MNDWYFLVLFEILGYLEGDLRRDSSSGSRGGGSRLCKQYVNSKIDLKKNCVTVHPCDCLGPTVQQQIKRHRPRLHIIARKKRILFAKVIFK